MRPRKGCEAGSRHGAKRIVAETDLRLVRSNAALLKYGGKILSGILVLCTEIELERDPGVEIDAAKGSGDRFFCTGEAVAVATVASRKDKAQSGCAVLEIQQRLPVGGLGIGMVDTLDDLPGNR